MIDFGSISKMIEKGARCEPCAIKQLIESISKMNYEELVKITNAQISTALRGVHPVERAEGAVLLFRQIAKALGDCDQDNKVANEMMARIFLHKVKGDFQ